MKKIGLLISLLFLSVLSVAQTSYNPPTVYVSSGLTVKRTAGTVNSGGKPVAVAADTTGAAMTANKNDCSSPSYTSCNIIYSDNTGTVSATTSIATATGSGNVVLAYVTTGASTVTSIVYGWQNGTVFSGASATTGGATSVSSITCGTSATCATPTSIATGLKIVIGTSGALNAASPSVATVSGISPAFTSSSSYRCTGTINGNTAVTTILAISYVSGSSFTFTGTNGASETIDYICVGN